MNKLHAYPEEDLLASLAKGSEKAFRQLYDLHHQQVYSFAFFLTRSGPLAEEVTQDIFIKIWTNREQLTSIDNFPAWLKVVVRNQSFTYLKRLIKEREILKEIATSTDQSTDTTEQTVLHQELGRLLNEAVNSLTSQQKKIYLLHRQQGLKYEEIAEATGLSVNTVKTHLRLALQSIRQHLAGRIDIWIAMGIALFFPD